LLRLWLIFPSLLHSVLFVQSHSASVFLRFDPTHFLTFDAKQVRQDLNMIKITLDSKTA
jgi:hypothetical protein